MIDTTWIPLSVPCLSGREAEYVNDCLSTNWISSVGAYVERFEDEFARLTGTPGAAVAVVNGTAALHLALLVAGVGEGDDVIVPALTFISSANAVAYCRAQPVFADCDASTLGLDALAVERLIEDHYEPSPNGWRHRGTGRRLAAIMPVHILGHACRLPPLMALAERYGLELIEDAAEGVGCYLDEQHVGTFGRVGCFSFNGNKIVSTGGGGMVVCRAPDDAARVRHLSTQAKADEARFLHDAIGYNYRLSNLHAAIGVGQLEHLAPMLQRRRSIIEYYDAQLAPGGSLSLFKSQPWCRANHWLALVFVAPDHRECLLSLASERRIQARPFWGLLHRQPPYQDAPRGELQVAEQLQATAVCLPCHAGMSDAQIERVCRLLKDAG